MTELISLLPDGYRTPEGVKRVNQTMEAFEASASPLANATMNFLREHGEEIKKAVEANSNSLVGTNREEDFKKFVADLLELRDLAEARLKALNEFLKAASGR
jgi:hypothetical protein